MVLYEKTEGYEGKEKTFMDARVEVFVVSIEIVIISLILLICINNIKYN